MTEDETRLVLEHVARAGFDPEARERVRGRLAGAVWQGRTLRGSDRLPPAELKYLWHVLTRREWPDGTTLHQYVESIRQVILDPCCGGFVSRFQGEWQLGLVRDSGDLRGPNGSSWILIEYRLVTNHWVTAFQPHIALAQEVANAKREGLRWLRRPRRIDG